MNDGHVQFASDFTLIVSDSRYSRGAILYIFIAI